MLATQKTLIQRLLPTTGALARPFLRDSILVACGTLLLALSAQISFFIPTTPVPITMQTFAVLLIGALYGARLGAITMVVYLLEGLLGLPVFSFGRNAWTPSQIPTLPLILGPTAGYLLTYPFVAAVVGLLAQRGWDRQIRSAVPAMLLGNVIILLGGFAWFVGLNAFLGKPVDLGVLFAATVLPFLPGDALKLLLAALALPGGWALLGKNKQ